MNEFCSWEELKQRFGPDIKLVNRIIIIDYVFMFSFSLAVFINYFFSLDFDLYYLYIPFFILTSGINWYSEKKLNLKERLKGSQFKKRVDTPLRVIFLLFLLTGIVLGFSEEFKTQTIHEAIQDFGYETRPPTYIPFKPTKEYGWIDKELDQLQLSYQKRISTELVIYVTPQKPEYFNENGEKIHLFENSIGFYSVSESGDPRIDWERDGLYYSLEYVSQDPSTKSEILKIVNSMK
ncbi:hypothetical protein J7E63_26745 [Bacillus sp. ISL-75]|uniref:hypothetical protein n=1 Tax=Bacillus sp. ISL-75 TaxID=2819137 RepID=UPI001BE5B504|nr:hypothetical protein [Bacillus sp. ISL-75]MBT2730433.1 hypothetical protein [Bacillus sp. ISL-75]